MKKCLRCGRCCKTTTLLEDSDWKIKLMRFIIIIFKYQKALFKKPDCPFLTYENGIAKCLNYKRRPQFCRDYFCERC